MGSGIDLGNPSLNREQRKILEDLRDQLLIVFLNRLKDKDGKVRIPVKEIDGTGAYMVDMQLAGDRQSFEFFVSKKS